MRKKILRIKKENKKPSSSLLKSLVSREVVICRIEIPKLTSQDVESDKGKTQ